MVVVHDVRVEPAPGTPDFWRALRDRGGGETPGPPPWVPSMEAGVRILSDLDRAPPRTLHSAPLVKSSPLSPPVRAMLETREFGRRFDTVAMNLEPVGDLLPPLAAPDGEVPFLASDRSLEDLSLSVDGLLQHRKRLLAARVDRSRPRRRVLVIGAGPAGLMSAVQLLLRNHSVVVCEARAVYSRNRYIGVYKEIAYLMAALGMPEAMTYDFSQYRGKRGIMLADIQTLLHGVALKLGAVIYTGAIVRGLDATVAGRGEAELQRAPRSDTQTPSEAGMTRWHHDRVSSVSSGLGISFDTIIEATGGRSGLRESLVGRDNVVSLHDIGAAAVREDPSLASFLDDPEDHCAEYVESGYGCPPGTRPAFASALAAGERSSIPDEIPCFVSNIDASIFRSPMHQTEGSLGLASRIADRTLDIPHDWVVLECRVSDHRLTRYHIEGPLPQSFEFAGERHATAAVLEKLNPVSLLLRILYAMGVPFEAIDRRQLVDFYAAESSQTDAGDIVGTWIGRFRGLRVGGEKPIWCGKVPGGDGVEYAIIGEALQNAWYRFGVGVDDAITGAEHFAAGLDLGDEERFEKALRFERVVRSRAVQILYHLFAVARNLDQGVVGSVLTEYYMEEQHERNLAEARVREVARDGAEMYAVASDLARASSDLLVNSAIDYLRAESCRRAIDLLESLVPSDGRTRRPARLPIVYGTDWADRARRRIDEIASPEQRRLLSPLAARPDEAQRSEGVNGKERLLEIASGRYHWASPWLRACSLRALDPEAPNAAPVLEMAGQDQSLLVAETARAMLDRSDATADSGRPSSRTLTVDRALVLKRVAIFESVPLELLADVAPLLTERFAAPGESVITKGAVGDSLYVIVQGRVRVHDGDRTLREMATNESFGELALLDTEPRAASVTAIEPTHLFRLGQNEFYELLALQPEITRSVNRALCRLVRGT